MFGNAFFIAASFLCVSLVFVDPATADTAEKSGQRREEQSAQTCDPFDPGMRRLLDALRTQASETVPETPEAAPDESTEKDSEESVKSSDQLTYPGVTNQLLHKGGQGEPSVNIYYPVFGNPVVDKAMRDFAENEMEEYAADIRESVGPDGVKPPSYDMWDMAGYFTLNRPNPDVASVTFNTYTYSGGAHGNLSIRCLNYDLRSGKAIDFADLFKDPEKALEIFVALSPHKLIDQLGEDADEEMIRDGTSDDLANFGNLSLTPEGLFIEFQPYQVGPWSIGPRRVFLSLAELAPAGPEESIWPAAANSPEKDQQ